MVDIFIHQYQNGELASAYNAAHKYRFARKMGMNTILLEKTWQRGKKKYWTN